MGMPYGLQSMLKEGYKHLSGLEEAVLKNIEACKQLAMITRTSMGPNGTICSLLLVLKLKYIVLYVSTMYHVRFLGMPREGNSNIQRVGLFLVHSARVKTQLNKREIEKDRGITKLKYMQE